MGHRGVYADCGMREREAGRLGSWKAQGSKLKAQSLKLKGWGQFYIGWDKAVDLAVQTIGMVEKFAQT